MAGMRWKVWAAFALFCLLSSSAWLFPTTGEDAWRGIVREGFALAAAGVFGLPSWIVHSPGLRKRRGWHLLALAGAAFFTVPTISFAWTTWRLSDQTRMAGLAGVPVAIVVIESLTRDQARRMLVPALAGLSGALLLLQFETPRTLGEGVALGGLVLAVLLMATLSVWMNRVTQGVELGKAIAVACLPCTALLLIAGMLHGESTQLLRSWGVADSLLFLRDGLVAALAVWLLRDMDPLRFAARYFVVPLVALLGSFFMWRPEVTVRMGCGLALLCFGAILLLVKDCRSEREGLSLR